MSFGAYLLGSVELVAVVAALSLGAVRARRRLLPGWSGAPARLCEAVLVVAGFVWVGELLGLIGALSEVPFVAACLVVGAGAAILAPRLPALTASEDAPACPPVGRLATGLAVGVAALVVARWSLATQFSLDRGMYAFDTLWYHMPFAARFAQEGSITGLNFTNADILVWFFPQNSELLHAEGIVLFGRDILSPLANMGWVCLALLAAWCVGRPYGAGPLTLLAAAIALNSQMLVRSQPGDASNDIAALALFLSSLALLANAGHGLGGRAAGSLLPAGAAAGLAVGTKIVMLAPVGALSAGVVAIASRGRRLRSALVWGAALTATGGLWFVRNLVATGNPLPWLKDLGVGPLELPGPQGELGNVPGHTVAHYLGDGRVWSDFFLPALDDRLGPLWWAVVGVAVAGGGLALWRGHSRGERMIGAVALVALAAYLFTPNGAAGAEGEPHAFSFNLRYIAPGLVTGLVLLPISLDLREPRRRASLTVLLVVLFVVTARPDAILDSGYLGGAVAMAVLLVLVPAGLALLAARGTAPHLLAGAAAIAVAIAVAIAWPEERDYLRHRYAERTKPGFLLSRAYSWAHDVSDTRIGTTFPYGYGLYGADLSNRVEYVGSRGAHGAYEEVHTCEEWKRMLTERRYEYVVIPFRPDRSTPGFSPETAWTRADRGAEAVVEEGAVAIYRLAKTPSVGDCERPIRRGPGIGAPAG